MLTKQEIDKLLAEARPKIIRKANATDFLLLEKSLRSLILQQEQAGLEDAVTETLFLIKTLEQCGFQVVEESDKNISFTFQPLHQADGPYTLRDSGWMIVEK